jgi:hypothetical protein
LVIVDGDSKVVFGRGRRADAQREPMGLATAMTSVANGPRVRWDVLGPRQRCRE